MVCLVASGLQILVYLTITTISFSEDDWQQYFSTSDAVLRLRLNIYFFLLISMIGELILIVWVLRNFFKRTSRFPAAFMTFIGLVILIEVIRILLFDYYAELANVDRNGFIDTNLYKTGIAGILTGLYLFKGKRPVQTFVN